MAQAPPLLCLPSPLYHTEVCELCYHMDHKRKKSGETSFAKYYDFQANTVNFGIIQTWQLYRLMKLNDLDYEVYNWHTTKY